MDIWRGEAPRDPLKSVSEKEEKKVCKQAGGEADLPEEVEKVCLTPLFPDLQNTHEGKCKHALIHMHGYEYSHTMTHFATCKNISEAVKYNRTLTIKLNNSNSGK